MIVSGVYLSWMDLTLKRKGDRWGRHVWLFLCRRTQYPGKRILFLKELARMVIIMACLAAQGSI